MKLKVHEDTDGTESVPADNEPDHFNEAASSTAPDPVTRNQDQGGSQWGNYCTLLVWSSVTMINIVQ